MDALACTLGAFALILILARLKVPLALAALIGAACIGFLFDLNAGQTAGAMLTGAIQPRTVALLVIITLLLGLSGMMRAGGQLDEIVSLAAALLRRRATTMAALPAIIGLLPMPGGALLSAPMVESAAGDSKLSGSALSSINFWYRHIWEFCWPLFPGVLLALASEELHGGYGYFLAFQFPLCIFMAASGLLLFRNTHPNLRVKTGPPPKGTKRKLIWATSSIWVIIVVWIPANYAVRLWFIPNLPETLRNIAVDTQRYIPLLIGLIVSIVWTATIRRLSAVKIAKSFMRRMIFTMALVIAGIMIFKHMLDEVGAPEQIAEELQALHVPVVLVVTALPFIAGMVTGLAVGFVGTSFPIVLPLAAAQADFTSIGPYMALAYAFGHMGQMVSPLHICYIMSNRYFKTPFAPVYRRLSGAVIVMIALTVAYFAILRALL